MKKTLTVNLGGTVFHIDEDAYSLLDDYLANLRLHFKKEAGSEEIMEDFEVRISELFAERIRLGYEVITIEHVESIIKRMGKPEDLFGDETVEDTPEDNPAFDDAGKQDAPKRLFRDPDCCVFGGVAGGIAAYTGWDVSAIRVIFLVLLFAKGISIPIYLILWLAMPLARTATDKLQMRGESITLENIGKAFTKNEKENEPSGRPILNKILDSLVTIITVALKVVLIIALVFATPGILLGLFILFVVLFAVTIGGGLGLLSAFMPGVHWGVMDAVPDWALAVSSVSMILALGIPMFSLLYMLISYLFKFKPVSSGVKWAWIIVWVVSVVTVIVMTIHYHIPIGETLGLSFDGKYVIRQICN
jgi:Putative stress-responsive transcriptional regulator